LSKPVLKDVLRNAYRTLNGAAALAALPLRARSVLHWQNR